MDWSGPSLAPFYSTVLRSKHQNQALWNGIHGGAQTRLATDPSPADSGQAGNRVYAFTRTRGTNTVLVVVNFGPAPITVSYSGLGDRSGTYTDWFSRATVPLGGAGRLEVAPNGWRVLAR